MGRPIVYFARAVDGLDRDAVLAAGAAVADSLRGHGIEMIDPVLRWETAAPRTATPGDPSALVWSDLGYLRRADGLLVDMAIPGHTYVGCVCELTYAHLWRIPSVVWVGDTGLERRSWLRHHATRIVSDRAEAITAIVDLLPGRPGSGSRLLDDQ
jgi:hypothetical protein